MNSQQSFGETNGLSVRRCPGRGNPKPTYLLVGEAPGFSEDIAQEPFIGAAGQELDAMLEHVGIETAECYFTNVIKYRPEDNNIELCISSKKSSVKKGFQPFRGRWISPDARVAESFKELAREIVQLQPTIIIALGDTAMWALTGCSGIMKYRSSCLYTSDLEIAGQPVSYRVIPTYHPAAVLRMQDFRVMACHDLRRCKTEAQRSDYLRPDERIKVRPTFGYTIETLELLYNRAELGDQPFLLAADIETRNGYMACLGLAYKTDCAGVAISIPFMCVERPEGYWSVAEEFSVRKRIRQLLTHPRVAVVWQNGMYDCQYFIREDSYMPNATHDTMLAQHAIFPGTPKDLNTLSSLYREYHIYWKDEGKQWHWKMDEDSLWQYNAKDCLALFDIIEDQLTTLRATGREHVYQYLLGLYWPVQAMMTKGVRLDWDGILAESKWVELEMELALARLELRWGKPLNPRSALQLKNVFYGDLGIKPILSTKTRKPTLDEEALRQVATKQPWTKLLSDLILEFRQNGTFRSTFLEQRRSPDSRFHTAFNIGGPETFRFSASANAFGEGCNGQNLPPRFKRFVQPDPGYELEDWDLDRADAQVVAWEADDSRLKELFRAGRNIHVENCKLVFPQTSNWSDEAIQASSKDANPALKFYTMTKSAIHAINYGVYKRTLARTLGSSEHEAQRIINRWLGEHPAIAQWHASVEMQLQINRTITNAFGFSRTYFGRMDPKMLQEALAWLGQSTTAIVITKGLVAVYRQLPEVDLLLQVHDSLLMQVPIGQRFLLRPQIKRCLEIEVPYAGDPLTIPVGGAASETNWLSVKEFDV